MVKRETLAVYLLRTVGWQKTNQVGGLLASWALAQAHTDGPLTVDGYALYWRQGRATAFREMARFREVMAPLGWDTPAQLIADLEAHKLERSLLGMARMTVRCG